MARRMVKWAAIPLFWLINIHSAGAVEGYVGALAGATWIDGLAESAPFTFGLHAGVSVNPRFELGASFNTFSGTVHDPTIGIFNVTFQNWMLDANFFPWPALGLWLGAEVGPSIVKEGLDTLASSTKTDWTIAPSVGLRLKLIQHFSLSAELHYPLTLDSTFFSGGSIQALGAVNYHF